MPRRPARSHATALPVSADPADDIDHAGIADIADSGETADHEAATRVMDALRRLVRELSTSARGARRPAGRSNTSGLSGARLYVMRQIAATPGLSIGELATRTHARQSTVSEVVARLVDAGLVARRASETDARQASLSLTARGRRAIAGAEPTAQERLLDALTSLAPAQREVLASALEAWLAAAGLTDVPATMFFETETDA